MLVFRAKSVSNSKDIPQSTTNLPAINTKAIIEEDEESKGPTNCFIYKRGISQVTRRQIQVNRSLNDQAQRKRGFTVNTYPSRSELETLQLVIQKNDWQEGTYPFEGHLVWYGLPLREWDMKQLQKKPKLIFNKYPGSEYLWRKKTLSILISRMKRYFPEEYNFMPKEYVIPEEQEELEAYIKKHPANWMIAKPSRGRGGEGIFIFKGQFNPPFNQTEFVVQKYISKPMLVEAKKFDIRLYVLITKLDPVECYFWNEGMVRFWTEDYKRPTKDNSKELCKHLTNFCINKESENYINPQEYGEENRGSKRLFSKFFEQLVKDSEFDNKKVKRLFSKFFEQLVKDSEFDNKKVKSEIISTIKKTIITLIPYLRASSKKWINPDLSKVRCFQLIGIDILLDQNNKAWLMEINANPSMNMFLEKINAEGEYERTLSELDKYLKCLVIEDAIKIVKSKKPLDDWGIYTKILPSDDELDNRYYISSQIINNKLYFLFSPTFGIE